MSTTSRTASLALPPLAVRPEDGPASGRPASSVGDHAARFRSVFSGSTSGEVPAPAGPAAPASPTVRNTAAFASPGAKASVLARLNDSVVDLRSTPFVLWWSSAVELSRSAPTFLQLRQLLAKAVGVLPRTGVARREQAEVPDGPTFGRAAGMAFFTSTRELKRVVEDLATQLRVMVVDVPVVALHDVSLVLSAGMARQRTVPLVLLTDGGPTCEQRIAAITEKFPQAVLLVLQKQLLRSDMLVVADRLQDLLASIAVADQATHAPVPLVLMRELHKSGIALVHTAPSTAKTAANAAALESGSGSFGRSPFRDTLARSVAHASTVLNSSTGTLVAEPQAASMRESPLANEWLPAHIRGTEKLTRLRTSAQPFSADLVPSASASSLQQSTRRVPLVRADEPVARLAAGPAQPGAAASWAEIPAASPYVGGSGPAKTGAPLRDGATGRGIVYALAGTRSEALGARAGTLGACASAPSLAALAPITTPSRKAEVAEATPRTGLDAMPGFQQHPSFQDSVMAQQAIGRALPAGGRITDQPSPRAVANTLSQLQARAALTSSAKSLAAPMRSRASSRGRPASAQSSRSGAKLALQLPDLPADMLYLAWEGFDLLLPECREPSLDSVNRFSKAYPFMRRGLGRCGAPIAGDPRLSCRWGRVDAEREQAGNLDEERSIALHMLTSAVRAEPTNRFAWAARAAVLASLQRWAVALRDAHIALAADMVTVAQVTAGHQKLHALVPLPVAVPLTVAPMLASADQVLSSLYKLRTGLHNLAARRERIDRAFGLRPGELQAVTGGRAFDPLRTEDDPAAGAPGRAGAGGSSENDAFPPAVLLAIERSCHDATSVPSIDRVTATVRHATTSTLTTADHLAGVALPAGSTRASEAGAPGAPMQPSAEHPGSDNPAQRAASADAAFISMALYNRAVISTALGDHVHALHDLAAALELSPGDVDARMLRALLRRRQGDVPGAADDTLTAKAAQQALARELKRAGRGSPGRTTEQAKIAACPASLRTPHLMPLDVDAMQARIQLSPRSQAVVQDDPRLAAMLGERQQLRAFHGQGEALHHLSPSHSATVAEMRQLALHRAADDIFELHEDADMAGSSDDEGSQGSDQGAGTAAGDAEQRLLRMSMARKALALAINEAKGRRRGSVGDAAGAEHSSGAHADDSHDEGVLLLPTAASSFIKSAQSELSPSITPGFALRAKSSRPASARQAAKPAILSAVATETPGMMSAARKTRWVAQVAALQGIGPGFSDDSGVWGATAATWGTATPTAASSDKPATADSAQAGAVSLPAIGDGAAAGPEVPAASEYSAVLESVGMPQIRANCADLGAILRGVTDLHAQLMCTPTDLQAAVQVRPSQRQYHHLRVILEALSGVPWVRALSRTAGEALAQRMLLRKFPSGSLVMQEGQATPFLGVVMSGTLQVRVSLGSQQQSPHNAQPPQPQQQQQGSPADAAEHRASQAITVDTLSAGSLVGALSMVFGPMHALTVVAHTDAELLVLPATECKRAEIRAAVGSVLTRIVSDLRSSKAFPGMTEDELLAMAAVARRVSARKGETIFAQGADPSGLFVLLRGTVHAMREGDELAGLRRKLQAAETQRAYLQSVASYHRTLRPGTSASARARSASASRGPSRASSRGPRSRGTEPRPSPSASPGTSESKFGFPSVDDAALPPSMLQHQVAALQDSIEAMRERLTLMEAAQAACAKRARPQQLAWQAKQARLTDERIIAMAVGGREPGSSEAAPFVQQVEVGSYIAPAVTGEVAVTMPWLSGCEPGSIVASTFVEGLWIPRLHIPHHLFESRSRRENLLKRAPLWPVSDLALANRWRASDAWQQVRAAVLDDARHSNKEQRQLQRSKHKILRG